MNPDEVRRHQAVHEAGHAVVGRSLGFHVDEIRFYSSEERNAMAVPVAATTRFMEAGGNPLQLMSQQPELMGITLMAGTRAEYVLLERFLHGGYEGDNLIFQKCHPAPGLTAEEVRATVTRATDEALRLVNEFRHEISIVAERLIETDRLTGSELDALLAQAGD